MAFKHILLYTIIGLCFAASVLFVYHNYSFYERPIAKVIKISLRDTEIIVDSRNNEDRLFTQQIVTELKWWYPKSISDLPNLSL